MKEAMSRSAAGDGEGRALPAFMERALPDAEGQALAGRAQGHQDVMVVRGGAFQLHQPGIGLGFERPAAEGAEGDVDRPVQGAEHIGLAGLALELHPGEAAQRQVGEDKLGAGRGFLDVVQAEEGVAEEVEPMGAVGVGAQPHGGGQARQEPGGEGQRVVLGVEDEAVAAVVHEEELAFEAERHGGGGGGNVDDEAFGVVEGEIAGLAVEGLPGGGERCGGVLDAEDGLVEVGVLGLELDDDVIAGGVLELELELLGVRGGVAAVLAEGEVGGGRGVGLGVGGPKQEAVAGLEEFVACFGDVDPGDGGELGGRRGLGGGIGRDVGGGRPVEAGLVQGRPAGGCVWRWGWRWS